VVTMYTKSPETFYVLSDESKEIDATRTHSIYFHSHTHFLPSSFLSPLTQGRCVRRSFFIYRERSAFQKGK
jgi:hypothetical protein